MKIHKTYSLNIEVVKAFEEEVDDQTRSRLIEALMINFLVEYSRVKGSPKKLVRTPIAKEEIP